MTRPCNGIPRHRDSILGRARGFIFLCQHRGGLWWQRIPLSISVLPVWSCLLLRPLSVCYTRIQRMYNNCTKCINKATRCYSISQCTVMEHIKFQKRFIFARRVLQEQWTKQHIVCKLCFFRWRTVFQVLFNFVVTGCMAGGRLPATLNFSATVRGFIGQTTFLSKGQ